MPAENGFAPPLTDTNVLQVIWLIHAFLENIVKVFRENEQFFLPCLMKYD